jgi:hypothetical protein
MKYLTAKFDPGTDDGAPSQMHRRLSIWAYCKLNEIQYVHTPFFTTEHNYDNDPEFENKWENFFNLGHDELSLNDVDESELNYEPYMAQYFNQHGMDLYDQVRDEYLKKYFKTKKPKLVYDENYINVAVHVRRGDICGKHRFKRFGLPDEYYISVMEKLNNELKETSNKKIKFYVFSEYKTHANKQLGVDLTTGKWGKYNSTLFNKFENLDLNYELILNGCPFSDFHHLLMSDILVTSKSYFSFVPALLTTGDVMWHPWNQQTAKSYWKLQK